MLRELMKKLIFSKRKVISNKEFYQLVKKMDEGNYNFSLDEERKMIRQWHIDNSLVPIPTKIKELSDNEDAIKLNSIELSEISFKLPYGIAYEESHKKEYENLVNLVCQQGIDFNNKVILDAGCGFGGLLMTVYIKFPHSRFIGIECAKSAIELLEKRIPWSEIYILQLESDTPLFLQQFPHRADIIFCTHVLEHLQKPKVAIQNLLKVKKESGVIVLVVPNGRKDSTSQHINFWSSQSWKIFIEDCVNEHNIRFLQTTNLNASSDYNLCAIIS